MTTPVLLLLALMMGGCGGSAETETTTVAAPTETAAPAQTETTESAEATANPCAAVSAEDVSRMTGMLMAVHEGDNENGCSYRTADDRVKLIVKTVDAAGFDAVAAMKGSEPISSLGDRASWNPSFNSLLVVRGDRMLDVTYDESPELTTFATPEEKKQRVTALAGKLITTL
jgi:hypothetical protein